MKLFITSINEKLYQLYGKRFIESWLEHAKFDVKLVICFEGDISDEIMAHSNEKLIITNINTVRQQNFLAKFGKFNEARGIRFSKNTTEPKTLKYSYNYRYDAIRFSFKIFSFIRCLELGILNSDFAWLDADVVCLKNFDSNDMEIIFPEKNQLASYLGRTKFPLPNAYSECGFIGYNFNHPNCIDFINDMYEIYKNGEVFTLKEWHDCMVFDHVRAKYESNGLEFKNLSAHLPEADHPFMLTQLSKYFDHLKGPERKKVGHS